MDKGSGRIASTPRVTVVRLLLLAALASLPLGLGCATGPKVNPALQLTSPKLIEEATKRGISIINSGSDPYAVYTRTTKEVNLRVGSDAIVRTAAICLPKEELAFQVAVAGDPSDEGAKRVADAALQQINRRVKFTVVLQLVKSHDPAEVTFELVTNQPKPYPALAVEKPQFIQDVSSGLDSELPATAIYGYNVHFSTAGSPGYPVIDSTVSSLSLVITSGGASTQVPFGLPTLTIGE